MNITWIGLQSNSSWIRNATLAQLSRLPTIPAIFDQDIIRQIIRLGYNDEFAGQKNQILAQLSKFPDQKFYEAAQLLDWMPKVDFGLALLSIAILAWSNQSNLNTVYFLAIYLLLLYISKWYLFPFFFASDSRRISSLSNPIGLAIVSVLVIGFLSFWLLNSQLISPISLNVKALSFLLFLWLNLWTWFAFLQILKLKKLAIVWWPTYMFSPLINLDITPFRKDFFSILAMMIQEVNAFLLNYVYIAPRLFLSIKILNRFENRLVIFLHLLRKYPSYFATPLLTVVIVASLFGSTSSLIILVALFPVIGFITIIKLAIDMIGDLLAIFQRTSWGIADYVTFRMRGVYPNGGFLDFINFVENYRTAFFRGYIIRNAMRTRSVHFSIEDIEHLRTMISFISTGLFSGFSPALYQNLRNLDQSLASNLGVNPRQNRWDNYQLDLLCSMLEQNRKSFLEN